MDPVADGAYSDFFPDLTSAKHSGFTFCRNCSVFYHVDFLSRLRERERSELAPTSKIFTWCVKPDSSDLFDNQHSPAFSVLINLHRILTEPTVATFPSC